MSDDPDAPPFQYGDVVTISNEATGSPSPIVGTVRTFGTYPAPWVQLEEHGRREVVVFLGPGVVVRF